MRIDLIETESAGGTTIIKCASAINFNINFKFFEKQ